MHHESSSPALITKSFWQNTLFVQPTLHLKLNARFVVYPGIPIIKKQQNVTLIQNHIPNLANIHALQILINRYSKPNLIHYCINVLVYTYGYLLNLFRKLTY